MPEGFIQKAKEATSRKEMLKYAKKALKENSNSYEARMMLVEETGCRYIKIRRLERLLSSLESKIQNQREFEQYIDTYIAYIIEYILANRYQKALNNSLYLLYVMEENLNKTTFEDIINVVHMVLHCALYANDYDKAKEICEKYNDSSLGTLVPMMLIHYQNDSIIDFVNCVNKIKIRNYHFINILANHESVIENEINQAIDYSCYKPGEKGEAICLLQEYADIIYNNTVLLEWFKNRFHFI